MIALFILGMVLIVVGTVMDKRERRKREREWEEDLRRWRELQ